MILGNSSHDRSKVTKALSNSSTPWLGLKDPRIVRVSRAFGGKDRHSKVRTIRGLRDRRVRLSVPTAIQLYDLQERLGLNQPSKVIDWLLNAAKNEIDELPPLPLIPPESFGVVNHQNNSTSELEASIGLSRSKFPNLDINWRVNASKQVARDQTVINEKEIWINSMVEQSNDGYHCELTNFPASQTRNHGLITSRESEIPQNSNGIPLQYPALSLSPGSRLFLWPDHQVTQSYFPQNVTPTWESDSRHANHFPMMSSSSSSQNLLQHSLTPSLYSISQSMRPFQFSINPKFFPSAKDSGDHKEREFPNK